MFTLKQALSKSCEASLVKNVSIMTNCYFTKIKDVVSKHENIHDTHYLFFINKTRVSIVCPNLEPQVAAIYGLYKVPDQCELHAPGMSTIANRQNTFEVSKDEVLLNIDFYMSNRR